MENLIGSLFNRAILDSIVGALTLVVLSLASQMLLGQNLVTELINSPYKEYTTWILLITSFLLGHLVDRTAFLLFDHRLFAKYFQSRYSTFDLPEWCQFYVEQKVAENVTVKATNERDLIDDSKTDWISAMFLAEARPEHLAKRSDLIANFQFVSNLLLVFVLSILIVPAYFTFNVRNVPYAVFFCGCASLVNLFILALLPCRPSKN